MAETSEPNAETSKVTVEARWYTRVTSITLGIGAVTAAAAMLKYVLAA